MPFLGLVVLTLPDAAAAHVEVSPQRVSPGSSPLLAFAAPDERSSASVVALTVRLPVGFVVGSIKVNSGWIASASGRSVTWRGGRIPPRQFGEFSLRVATPNRRGSFALEAEERFSDGRIATFRPAIVLAPLPSASRAGRDTGARTLGKFALGVALAAFALALGAGALALSGWLVGWKPNRDEAETHDSEPPSHSDEAPIAK